ncbi:MAG: proline racemase family protein [Steroidobacteraceae bacterium]
MIDTVARARRVRVVDSHTGGEPTRVVLAGGPQLRGSLAERRTALQTHHGNFIRGVITEPRGSDVLVGALLCDAADCATGVIYFDNAGTIGMCGHGTIGVVATLEWLGRIEPGKHRVATPVGVVAVELHGEGDVSVHNVPAFRYRKDVTLDVPGIGAVVGDVAWGGNWFFIIDDPQAGIGLECADYWLDRTRRVRRALDASGLTGEGGAHIDHVQIAGPARGDGNDSRNFVLCPGGAYDRSPCGTGTSARMACLHADGRLRVGQPWRQESITGSVFAGSVETRDGQLLPTIRGRAWITADATLVFDPGDPLRDGMPGGG